MTRQHLRQQAGGDPAQGPVPELATDPSAPQDVNEFPDTPEDNRPGGVDDEPARDQDKPDLDAFAERIGTKPTDGSSGDAGDDSSDRAARERIDAVGERLRSGADRAREGVERSVSSLGTWLGRGLGAAGRVLTRTADRLESRSR